VTINVSVTDRQTQLSPHSPDDLAQFLGRLLVQDDSLYIVVIKIHLDDRYLQQTPLVGVKSVLFAYPANTPQWTVIYYT